MSNPVQRYNMQVYQMWGRGDRESDNGLCVVLASDYETLRTANQRLEGEVHRLRGALTLSRNLMLSKGCSESDPLGISAIDAALSTANGEVTE